MRRGSLVASMRSQRPVCSRGLAVAIASTVLGARGASAEVTIATRQGWEVFTAGRVDVFLGHAFGDAYPPSSHHLVGGGLDSTTDLIPAISPGAVPTFEQQGTISKYRLRSGLIPNVLTLGFRRRLTETMKLRAQLSVRGHDRNGQPAQVPTGLGGLSRRFS
jgi:hypothetical protein